MNELLKETEKPKFAWEDYFRMVRDISELVETDFCGEMELKLMPKSSPYTQEEAAEMANLIGRVYSIAHCIHCAACAPKYMTFAEKDSVSAKEEAVCEHEFNGIMLTSIPPQKQCVKCHKYFPYT